MKFLVDTHALLWFVSGDERLPLSIRALLESEDTEPFVSLASYWEISIKQSLGKLVLKDPIQRFIERRMDEGFKTLPIELAHVAKVGTLPFHHRDPFDRMIISQAICERASIITQDQHYLAYPITLKWL